jgi:CBS domain-containing protein
MKQYVTEIMSAKLITLHPKDKIARAEELFESFDIHHIPIVVMNKVVGIISQGDVLFLTRKPVMHSFDQFIKEKRINLGSIDEIMTTEVITVDAKTSISKVLEVFLTKRINAIPVLDNGEIVGLVTSFDMMSYLKTILQN